MPTTYAIPNGRTAMDALTYTGDGSSPRTISGWNFKPDFIWTKSRNAGNDSGLIDTNRGISGQYLNSDTTNAEWAAGANVTAFTSNGYTAITGTNNFTWGNTNGTTYVGWAWNAGSGSNVTNTTGTITSTVSANATAGFSIVTYTGTGAAATVGHGLGVAPQLVIVKDRASAYNWAVWHTSLTSAAYALQLNTTIAQTNAYNYWNSTAPTSSVFSLGTDLGANKSGDTFVAYCWAPVAGFSQFGSYTGNGSTNGPFIYTGFRPKFVMVKRTDSTGDWCMEDTTRDPYNQAQNALLANSASSELNYLYNDYLSNGFKIRNTDGGYNTNGGTYIYMAFAENPFKYANAR